MTCILVDDETSSRQTLHKMLETYCPDVSILAEAHSINSAYEAIIFHKPDLVFLDIEMPEGNAFDLLNKFDSISFKIIFTTAYEQYALEAIKVEAADYLLKPLSIKDLVNAVDKLKKKVTSTLNKEELLKLLSTFQIPHHFNPYIPIPTSTGYEMIHTNDIVRCEANESYTHIFLINQVKKTVSKKIGDIESTLSTLDFFRVHHSYIVNRKYIKNYVRGDGGSVQLTDHSEVPVSKRKKSEFIDWLTKG
jgi:two-component system, LytTR family, response regulator